jgi:DNA-binding CsgD family transcriptional regulator
MAHALAFKVGGPHCAHLITTRFPELARRFAAEGAITVREVEILRLVAQGLTDVQVAEQLVISPHTVNWHLTSIYSKLGVSSRTAATRFAIEQQLV